MRRYRQSPKGIAAQTRYTQSAKGAAKRAHPRFPSNFALGFSAAEIASELASPTGAELDHAGIHGRYDFCHCYQRRPCPVHAGGMLWQTFYDYLDPREDADSLGPRTMGPDGLGPFCPDNTAHELVDWVPPHLMFWGNIPYRI